MHLLNDLRFAARYLRKSPGFTTIAVLTLALGVGANTAVFSLLNAVLLRPLPYAEPDRLMLVWESAPFFGLHDSPVSPANFVDWQARARSFEEMAAVEDRSFRLTGERTPEVVPGAYVTANLWRALRTRAALGRVFRDDEDRLGAAKVAVISDSFWRTRFGASRDVVGRTITLNDEKHTIIGVLPAGAEPPAEYNDAPGQIWAPFGSAYSAGEWTERGRHNWMVIARLRPGITMTAADAEMRAIGQSLAREYPDTNEKVGAFVAPLREHFVGSSRRLLLVLVGTSAFVLLIACSNLANLMLSRAAGRSKEIAVRQALGAGAWQIVRQSFCESLILAVAGSAAGVLLASLTFDFLARLAPATVSGMNQLALDWRVLGITLGITVLTAVIFGLVPLVQVRRLDVSHALKQSARTLAGLSASRGLRAALICAEVALAFVLLVGAGLLIQTFARVRGVPVGFRTENILTMEMPSSAVHRGAGKAVAYQRQILARVRSVPGVRAAGFTNHIPLVTKGDISGVGAEGHDEKTRFQCRARMAGPGYFATMGIPVLRGRDVAETDTEGTPYVVLINETLARMAWPDRDPVGRRLIFGSGESARVIGVVGDIHQAGLDVAPAPEFYVSTLQVPVPPPALAIRTGVDPASVAGGVRQAIWAVDRDQPITEVATMEEILDREVHGRRLQMTLLGVFAGLALLLAGIGLYGVLSYVVGQQVPEIGIRMALGAAPRDVLRRVGGYALRLTVVGGVMGLAGALALSRVLSSFLFGVTSTDPLTYGVVLGVLLASAAAASYLPARRAMRVDPMTALREE